MKLKYISTLQAKAFIFNEYHHLLLFKFAFCSLGCNLIKSETRILYKSW